MSVRTRGHETFASADLKAPLLRSVFRPRGQLDIGRRQPEPEPGLDVLIGRGIDPPSQTCAGIAAELAVILIAQYFAEREKKLL